MFYEASQQINSSSLQINGTKNLDIINLVLGQYSNISMEFMNSLRLVLFSCCLSSKQYLNRQQINFSSGSEINNDNQCRPTNVYMTYRIFSETYPVASRGPVTFSKRAVNMQRNTITKLCDFGNPRNHFSMTAGVANHLANQRPMDDYCWRVVEQSWIEWTIVYRYMSTSHFYECWELRV